MFFCHAITSLPLEMQPTYSDNRVFNIFTCSAQPIFGRNQTLEKFCSFTSSFSELVHWRERYILHLECSLFATDGAEKAVDQRNGDNQWEPPWAGDVVRGGKGEEWEAASLWHHGAYWTELFPLFAYLFSKAGRRATVGGAGTGQKDFADFSGSQGASWMGAVSWADLTVEDEARRTVALVWRLYSAGDVALLLRLTVGPRTIPRSCY